MSKGLEALNYLKHRFEIARTNQTELDIIEKELKALEIISKKGILVNGLIKSQDLGGYNTLCNYHGMTEWLTQEEYDLLKEVLL